MKRPNTDKIDLFLPPPGPPEGFAYQPDILSPPEERALIARLAELDFKPFEFRGVLGRRRTVSFGWRYDFSGSGLTRAAPIPAWAEDARERAAALAGLPPDALEHLLINEYRPGAPIGWHRDRRAFGRVVGLSLLSACRLRFRRREGEGWLRAESLLEPRSAYLLAGPARWSWEHSVPPAPTLRYSLTFRALSREYAD